MKKCVSLFLSLIMLLSISVGTSTNAFASYDNIYQAYNYTFGEVYYGNITNNNYRDYLKFTVDSSMKGVTVEYKADVIYQLSGGRYSAIAISNSSGNNIYTQEVDYNQNLGLCYFKGTINLTSGTYYFYDYPDLYYNVPTGNFDVKITPVLKDINSFKLSSRTTNSLKFSWGKLSGVSGYELQQKSGNTWKTKVTTTSTSATVSKLSPGYNYAFRVRAYKIISGKKYYSNWKSITACTKPATAKLSGLTAYSNHKIKVSWKKVSGYASGYQIYWAKDKNFKKIVSKTTISGQSKTTYTGKNFTKGKRYYVKVRAYRTVNGTKYYGSWSNVKSIVSK